jgi:endonuclease/exonuclease/phosphatase (EEP) superfamily protein YafD
MKVEKRPFTHLAVFVLSIVALVQLLRLALGWEVVIQGYSVPMWFSLVALVVAGGLALTVWRESSGGPR